jgi:FkbM family methyltransferase
MSSSNSFDVRVINFIVRQLDKYVRSKNERNKINSDKVWSQLFGSQDNIIHKLDGDIKIKLYKDSVLSKFIYDNFETSEIDFLNIFLKEGDCFVDIGANIGLFSLYASKKVGVAGEVISFEPASTTYKRLLENIQLNHNQNIRPFHLGLSDKDEILDLNVSLDGHEAWNTFVPTTDNKFSLKEKVRVQAFDHFIRENSIDINKISLIKLDVEGFEINVFKGSNDLLSSLNAPAFLVEFTDENAISAGNCCHELYKFLLRYNYFWYTYDPIRKKLEEEPMRLNYPYNNLIAIKNGRDNKRVTPLF